MYEGSDCPEFGPGGVFHSKSMPVVKGVEEADKALKLERQERLGLVVELQPSEDEEDDDEEENDMDVDGRQIGSNR